MRPRLRGQGVWLWLLGAGALFTVVAVMAIFVPLAVVPSEGLTVNQRVTAENNLRTTLVQFAGGSILLFGTALTLYINREGQITERFTRAVDQLGQTGGDKLDVRLGGIYALERIARESSRDRGPIIEVLTAFLREHARWNPDNAEIRGVAIREVGPLPLLRADFQAVVTVLGRNRWSQRHPYNLRNVDLRGASLDGAHLAGAMLIEAHLEGVDLNAVHLEGAILAWAHLENAFLGGAHLQGIKLIEAHLEEADLFHAHLEDANLFAANLETANLFNANLEGAYLAEAILDNATLDNANLEGANLEGAILFQANLEGANLRDAHLKGASLGEADLKRATLAGANLEEADLSRARLDGATLLGAHMERTELFEAHLEGADLSGAHLEGVNGLTPAQVERVIGLNQAKGVPPGLLGT